MIAHPTPQEPNFEVVGIGDRPFQLFPQGKTQKRFSDIGKTNIYDRYIFLDTNRVLPLFPIRLYAGACHMSSTSGISPYTEGKKQKLEGMIDYAKAPLCLDASIHSAVLRRIVFTIQTQTLPSPFLPVVKEKLSHLRFHVLLPTKDTLDKEKPTYDTFEAFPDETALTLGELSFRRFTPQRSGSSKQVAKEYFLMLPSDETILQKLKGQFIIRRAA